MRLSNLASLLAVIAAPALPVPASAPTLLASATLQSPDGKPLGTARIMARASGAVLEVDMTGVTPGPHGLHLHTTGKCEGPDFASAGGHLNPAGHQHGADNPAGSHLGDLPNVTADAEGHIKVTIRTPMQPSELMHDLFDEDGTAIVLHAAADDYRTDPSGNSGARIACGVFAKP